MADKDLIIKEKVSNSGIFDFSGFYKYAHDWLEDENYGVIEDKYSEKVAGNARNLYIEWTAVKSFSDYFKIEIKIKFYIDNLTDVEVEIDGQKKKANKGVVTVELKGTVIKDPSSKWDTAPYLQFMRNLYNKYVIPARVESMDEKTMADVKTLKDELKAFLELSGKR